MLVDSVICYICVIYYIKNNGNLLCQKKNQVLVKLNKKDSYFYQIGLFLAKQSIFVKNKELNNISKVHFQMNKISNKFLLIGGKFMPELKTEVKTG